MAGPVATMLPGGRRLHLQHGPIDLVVEAWGAADETAAAYRQAAARFGDILETLVGELPALRAPVDGAAPPAVRGPVARRMVAAVWPHRAVFITPMAAVAGSVADEVLAATTRGRALERAYVNNGGDIAFHLAAGHALRLGVVADVDAPALDGFATLDASAPSRGLATSGWRGRSFSRGVADAVTTFAVDAASADAAATIVANAVDVEHAAVARAPARSLDPDSDLGDLPVTTGVGTLPPEVVDAALDRGATVADELLRRGLIHAATLMLQGRVRVVGALVAGTALR